MQAVIVAGGRGVRMRPWSDRIPKVMIPIAGKPLLEHQINWLGKSGIRHVVMCLGYKADCIAEHFGDGSRWGLRVDYHVEQSPRGTAGCVRDIWPLVTGDALVVYGDIYADFSLPELLACHRRSGGAATLVLADTDHPHDSDLVRMEGERITGFCRAAPGEACGTLACAAVWVVTGRLMSLVPRDRASDFGRDIFPLALARGERLTGFVTSELVADLGTPERMEAFLKRSRGAQT